MLWLLILQALIFVPWTIQMLVTLFRLRARAARDLGVTFPGPFSMLRYWGIWLRDPDTRGERMRLLVLTLAMFATILLQVAAIPQAS